MLLFMRLYNSKENIMNGKKTLLMLLVFLIALPLYSRSAEDTTLFQAENSNGVIDADNSNIQYVGRFDRSDQKRAIFDWPGI